MLAHRDCLANFPRRIIRMPRPGGWTIPATSRFGVGPELARIQIVVAAFTVMGHQECPAREQAENSRGERKRLSSAIRAASQTSSFLAATLGCSSNHARLTGRYRPAAKPDERLAQPSRLAWPNTEVHRPGQPWRVVSRTPTPHSVRGQCFRPVRAAVRHHAAFVEGQCITHRAAAACVALLALAVSTQVPDTGARFAFEMGSPNTPGH